MSHAGGASGSSPQLDALMAVNRVRYIRKYHSTAYSAVFHGAVAFSELLRCWKPDRRGVLHTVLNEGRWSELPGPSPEVSSTPDTGRFPMAR